MKSLLVLLAVIIALFAVQRLLAGETIKPSDAAQRVASGQAVLIDVREPSEWAATGVAEPAALLTLGDLQGARTQWKPFLEKNHGKELILYCRSGHRAGVAAKLLAKEGWTTANAGGLKDWTAAGLPVRTVKQP